MALGIIEPKTNERPPGTELLVDGAARRPGVNRIGGGSGLGEEGLKHGKGKKTDIILVPQPSNNPNDPLLWPTWKRETAFFTLLLNSILFAAVPGPMIAPATVALSLQLGVPIKKVSQLSGYQLLIVGALGPIVSVLAQKYGKRPQFLIASIFGVLGTGICISSFSTSSSSSDPHKPPSSSYSVLLAGRMIQGIGTTAYESLSVAALGDMFFLHERGLRTALVVLSLAAMSSFVAVVAGALEERVGARGLFVVLLPLQCAALVGAGFGLPEMMFRRGERGSGGDGLGGVGVGSRVGGEKGNGEGLSQGGEEEGRGRERGGRSEGGDKAVEEVESASGSGSETVNARRRTFSQDLRVFSGTYSHESVAKLVGSIFIHVLNPAVLWVQIVSAVLVSTFVGTAYTLAQTFTPPPFSLTVSQNGFFFTGAVVGGIIGVGAGPLCDLIARRLARRNGGIFEAEFRIPVCVVAVIVFGVGWFVFGWALDQKGPGGKIDARGIVLVCSVCYGCVCLATSVAGTGAGLYVLDAFPDHATEIFILQMMVKNFLFYAFSTFINDFAAEKGPAHMARVFGIATLAGFVTCIPMYMLGKVNRVKVAKWMPVR